MSCSLCKSSSSLQQYYYPQFYTCDHCGCVYRDPSSYLSAIKEKERYLAHTNDVNNIGYQDFVAPMVEAVLKTYNNQQMGLDFGAGTGPVISKLLQDKGYTMNLWDPFFHPNGAVLKQTYSFIVCSEVMEHFYHPLKEFILMKQLLKPKGKLFCKTSLLPQKDKFKGWRYKNDPTHVLFYSSKSLKWIKDTVGFRKVTITPTLITFEK